MVQPVLNSDDTVLATVPRALMAQLLTAIHRGGFGHLTKVLDEKRSPVTGQLERAGVEIPLGFIVEHDHTVVMISAPARTGTAIELLRRYGAESTWTAKRTSSPWPMFKTPLSTRARGGKPSDENPSIG
jgi:hypothetical protein